MWPDVKAARNRDRGPLVKKARGVLDRYSVSKYCATKRSRISSAVSLVSSSATEWSSGGATVDGSGCDADSVCGGSRRQSDR